MNSDENKAVNSLVLKRVFKDYQKHCQLIFMSTTNLKLPRKQDRSLQTILIYTDQFRYTDIPSAKYLFFLPQWITLPLRENHRIIHTSFCHEHIRTFETQNTTIVGSESILMSNLWLSNTRIFPSEKP